jgi:hypothetical protein
MPTLTAADGATFHAMIEEMPDGNWRASGVVRLDKKSEMQEQTSGVEMFPTEAAARAWVEKAGASRGFKSCKLQVRRQLSWPSTRR